MIIAERIEVETMLYPDALSAYALLPFGTEDVRISRQVKEYIHYCEAHEYDVDMTDETYHHVDGDAWAFEGRRYDDEVTSH
jgi:hypothetical protein